MPVIFAPLVQLPADAAGDVAASGEQRDVRGLVDRFETANDGL
jgi:hypothetical protein